MRIKIFFAILSVLLVIGLLFLKVGCGMTGTEDELETTTSVSSTVPAGVTTTTISGPISEDPSAKSVSGKVKFSTTSDGIKGGATVYIIRDGITLASTSADPDTGNYSFQGVLPDTYLISAEITGWDIPTITVVVGSNAVTNAHLTATPTKWEILNVEAGVTLVDVCSVESGDAGMFAIGRDGAGNAVIKRSTSGAVWTTATNNPTSETLVSVIEGQEFIGAAGSNEIIVVTMSSGIFRSDYGVNGWTYLGQVTTEAIKSISALTINAPIFDYVTLSGAVHQANNGGMMNGSEDFSDLGIGFAANDVKVMWDGFSTAAVGQDAKFQYFNNSEDQKVWKTYGKWTYYVTTEGITDNLMATDSAGNARVIVTEQGRIIFQTLQTAPLEFYTELSGIPYAFRGAHMQSSGSKAGVIVVGDNGLIMRRKKMNP